MALDEVREEMHKVSKLLFKQGASLDAVMNALLRVNELEDMAKSRKNISEACFSQERSSDQSTTSKMWSLKKDELHVLPTISMIHKAGAFRTTHNPIPRNVYKLIPQELHEANLNKSSDSTASHLLLKHLRDSNLFNIPPEDVKKSADELVGPAVLIKRARQNKSTTLKRSVLTVDSKVDEIDKKKRKIEN